MKKMGSLSSYHVYSRSLSCTFAQAVTNCLLSSAGRRNRAMCYLIKTITLEVNMIFTIFKGF